MANQQESAAELFEAALSLQPAEREAFLDRVCRDDSALRQMVEHLLAEDARAGSFLKQPAFGLLDTTAIDGADDSKTTVVRESVSGSTQSLQPGRILIDRFVIIRWIAKGGMGEVYEAEDRFLQNVHVALKTILPRVADQPAPQKRFEREVLLAREVVHPNLCPIYDIFHSDQSSPNFLFLTMKLLPGETLAARLLARIPISSEEGSAILKQAALGLAAIHAAGIVHRDIKPNNIMLDGAGADVRLWITDFGLARALESDTTLSGRGAVAGTPSYIAPELLRGYAPSQASDLFAFGVVMHEVFTGHKPDAASDSSSVIIDPCLYASGIQPAYAQLVRGCLDLDPANRCKAFEHALESFGAKHLKAKPWTRRQFIGTAAAIASAVAVGGWIERDTLYDLLHPLPGKRFVALMDWPKTTDGRVVPMLTGVLTAIKGELARIEAFDHDLFVISPEDIGEELASTTPLKEITDSLGANLVLAVSAVPASSHIELLLRLIDPATNRLLRQKGLTCALDAITSLPSRAVRMAASLLNLGRFLHNEPAQQQTDNPAAFTAFQAAENLMKQTNDAGLDSAIEKYKEAVSLDPHYASAYAELGIAYGRLFALRHDPTALALARANAATALRLNPDLVDSHLAMSSALEHTGDIDGALREISRALAIDPSNPTTLVWQAQIYTRQGRWADAEHTFNRVIEERPNSWLAYNELGYVLNIQAKYSEALDAFRKACLAAPGSSLARNNLGAINLQIGNFADATENFRQSLALSPNGMAAANTSLALRSEGKLRDALPFAQKSVELDPGNDLNWLELADCYASLGNQKEAETAYLQAVKEVKQRLQTDSTNGPDWMSLALYEIKCGNKADAPALIAKAESFGASDMDSQLTKARIQELLGMRDQALATLAACFHKGATRFEIVPIIDLQKLQKDPRYQQILRSNSPTLQTNQLSESPTP